MREIGSEFHYKYAEKQFKTEIIDLENGVLVFSGRTAIETVLKNEYSIHTASLPSYCCDSMIEPFRRAGIEVNFYSVNFDEGLKVDLDSGTEVDCILWCNYFGFNAPMPDLNQFISRGGIIIEDITHSFYSEQQSHAQSQYLVASLRKWEPLLSGGYCSSRKSALKSVPEKAPYDSFLALRKNAMTLKSRYLDGEAVDKSAFLHMFSESNEWLAEHFSGLSMDHYSRDYLLHMDYEEHRKQRIRNAQTLYKGLNINVDINFLFQIEDMDCPLFVPILIKNGKRDYIRKKLIDKAVYCPVHWPHPNAKCKSNLYDMELSLICDHRYNEEDMYRIIEILNKEI